MMFTNDNGEILAQIDIGGVLFHILIASFRNLHHTFAICTSFYCIHRGEEHLAGLRKIRRQSSIVVGGALAVALAFTAGGASAGTNGGGFLVEAVNEADPTIVALAGSVRGAGSEAPSEENPSTGDGGNTGTFAFTLKEGCGYFAIALGEYGDGVTLKDPQGNEVSGVLGNYAVTNPAAGQWVADGELSRIASSSAQSTECIDSVTEWRADDPQATDGTFSSEIAGLFSGTALKSAPTLPATVRNVGSLFERAQVGSFVNSWDTSRVVNMNSMFAMAILDPAVDLSKWNTGSVEFMTSMFSEANSGGALNLDLSRWNTANVRNMSWMFFQTGFNQPIGDWDTSKVEDMTGMFHGAPAFNQPIGRWDTSSVEKMPYMFHGAKAFNQPIGDWDTSKVRNMNTMFSETTAFNQPIGDWDVSGVATMAGMFYGAEAFNQPIGKWDVSSVTDMGQMFQNAKAFNSDVSGWNMTSVENKDHMFEGASSYSYPKP